jgi:lipid-A-disaccharide synthase
MFVIFPFEKEFYKNYDYPVEYVGNPLLDEIEKKKPLLQDRSDFISNNKLADKPIIALLAGSRKQEIRIILPEMLKMLGHFTEYQFVLAGAPSFNMDIYKPIINDLPVKVVFNQTYDLLKHAHTAIVTSGTATLETALFDVPQVVLYKMIQIQYDIGKYFIKVKFFSLVNIIMDCEIVKELLQNNLEQSIKSELDKLLKDNVYRSRMLENYKVLKNKLGQTGASKRTAEIIVHDLKSLTK